MITVAALYVSPLGPYPKLEGVECWDEQRNAKLYAGPHPVVAHPPCGPYSRLRYLCTKQDPECALRAVDQVRQFGGVLEHPEQSRLWSTARLPPVGGLPDAYGGRSYALRQVAWGHCCEKPTWLYTVGVAPELVHAGIRTGGEPTHRITSGPRGPELPSASRQMAIHSPPDFAGWLVSLARAANELCLGCGRVGNCVSQGKRCCPDCTHGYEDRGSAP